MKLVHSAHVGVVSVGLLVMSCQAARSEDLPGRAGAQEAVERPVVRLEFAREPLAVAFGPNGGKLVACSRIESAGVWNAADGHRMLGIANPTLGLFAAGITMSGNGRWIVTGGPSVYEEMRDLFRGTPIRRGSLATLWDAESGRLIRTFRQGNTHYFNRVAVNRSATRVACADYRLNTVLWDGTDGEVISMVDGPAGCRVSDGPCPTTFSADANRFVAVAVNLGDVRGSVSSLYLCDLDDRHTRTIPPMPEWGGRFGGVALSGDGKEIATVLHNGSDVRHLATIDFETGKIKAKIPVRFAGWLSYLAYSPDSSTIALGDSTGKVFLFDRAIEVRGVEVTSGTGPIQAVAFRSGSIIVGSKPSEPKVSKKLRAQNQISSLEVREHTIPRLRP